MSKYFTYRIERHYGYEEERHLCHPYIQDETGYSSLNDIFWHKNNTPILLYDHAAISWTKWNDPKYHLVRYDLSTKKSSYPDQGADDYILLGDYLYKRIGTDWYKTNISQGWESLQWEYLTI